MSERGEISIHTKKGEKEYLIHLGGEKDNTLRVRGFDVPEEYNGKSCEVESEGKKILKIVVDGKELPKKQPRSGEHRNKSESGRTKFDSPKQHAQNIYSIQNTKLPKGTRECLDNFVKDIDNFNLKLNKCVNFIFWNKEKEEATLYKSEYKDKNDNNKWKQFEISFNFEKLKPAVDAISNRQLKLKKYLELQGYKTIEPFICKPEWRMVIGLGNESVYETSMTLHHIYGIPYIPGQAVKGVLRNYIINEVFGEIRENGEIKLDLGGAEKRALTDEDFCKIFGSPKDSAIGEHIGSVIFFDAFPIETPTIKPDIMNVHYPDYYSGKKPPTDYQKLNPIYFLTVGEDEKGNKARFRFLIGVKKKDDFEIKNTKLTEKIKCNDVLSVIEHWLIKALNEHGIGAKTAVGYGYMDRVQYDN
ncbi:CRISPR-associated protein Cmr6 [Methanophagales archaeon]|nr:CRISPR-associated protein Cmr6 [Methanophagales archaeon]